MLNSACQSDVVNLAPSSRPDVFVTVEGHEMTSENLEMDWKVGERTAVIECDSPV